MLLGVTCYPLLMCLSANLSILHIDKDVNRAFISQPFCSVRKLNSFFVRAYCQTIFLRENSKFMQV